jgi:ubiquinone/menaquinone biosynthesis C-methylase UbiE
MSPSVKWHTNYDDIAELESLCCEEFDVQRHEVGLTKLVPQPGERILVIGFGTGHSLAEIARAVGANGKALGFDMSECSQRGCADAKFLPHEANSLDGIFTSYTLEQFDALPLATVLVECKRALRPGGRIVVIGLSNAREQGNDCGHLSRMLTAAGFAAKEAEMASMWAPIEIVLAAK